MRNIVFNALILMALLSSGKVHAQKYAYVDSQYILENMQSYKDAQEQLDQLSKQWQQEVEGRYETLDRLYSSFQAEKVLLTEEMRRKREEEIVRKENEAKDLQRQRFGVEGDLFKKRQELLQPVQTELYQAIKEMADQGGYMVVFDLSGQSNILYSDPRYNKSDLVLRKMGIRPGSGSDDDDDDADSRDSGGAGDLNSTPQRR